MDTNTFLNHYYSGLSDSKIAELYKIDRHRVSQIRKYLELPRMSKVQFYKSTIINLVDQGMSDISISKNIGISKSMVGYIRKRLKIKTNFIERTYKSKNDRIRGYMMRSSRGSAKRRNHEFSLEYTDIQLPETCPILGFKLDYKSNSNHYNHPSLDRIDNSKGYIKGNVMVISRLANAMKNEASFNQLEEFTKNILKVTNYYKSQGALGDITDVFPDIKLLEV